MGATTLYNLSHWMELSKENYSKKKKIDKCIVKIILVIVLVKYLLVIYAKSCIYSENRNTCS